MGRFSAIIAVILGVVLVTTPVVAEPRPFPVAYQAPVPGPIVDPYRPPTTPYGPGNRGVDYASAPGSVVAAPADGTVTFAGAVGGALHVVVLHADGIRTSLSFLAVVLVVRGQQVVRGQTVGRSGSLLHFGARRGEVYLDPTTLLSSGVATGAGSRSVLVPDDPGRPLGVEEEGAGLRRFIDGAAIRAVSSASNGRSRIAGAATRGSAAGAREAGRISAGYRP